MIDQAKQEGAFANIEKSAPRPPYVVWEDLFSGGLVRLAGKGEAGVVGAKKYQIDYDGVARLLEKELTGQFEYVPEQKITRQELVEEGQVVFREVVHAFVKHGDIPVGLAVKTGELIRPSDLIADDSNHARMMYLSNDGHPDKMKITVGKEIVDGRRFSLMKEATRACGISLTDKQIRHLAIRDIVSHEYGHAVDGALLKVQQVGIGEENWQVPENMRKYIYDELAPSEDLQIILGKEAERDYTSLPNLTSIERVAVGFEDLGMRYALEEMGVESDKAMEVLSYIREKDGKVWKSIVRSVELMRGKGLKLGDLFDIQLELGDHFKKLLRFDLEGYIRRMRLDTIVFGYYFPLSQEQLRAYVGKYFSEAKVNVPAEELEPPKP